MISNFTLKKYLIVQDNEVLISDTESVGEEIQNNKAAAAAASDTDKAKEEVKQDEASEEELAKAEAFKEKGNEFFKSKKPTKDIFCNTPLISFRGEISRCC